MIMTEIGMMTVWSIYCSKSKGFEPDYVKSQIQQCGFNFVTSQKIFAQLQNWRRLLPSNISDKEMNEDDDFRRRPN